MTDYTQARYPSAEQRAQWHADYIDELLFRRKPSFPGDVEFEPIGALFPDMLRLLCRWRWLEGGVVITAHPFRGGP